MKSSVAAAVLVVVSLPVAAAAQAQRAPARVVPSAPTKVAQAYEQFLLGHRLEDADDVTGAVAAYKRAMELDPTSSEIPAELAGLYLRQNRASDATNAAEQALKISPANKEANRVMGMVYASKIDTRNGFEPRPGVPVPDDVTKAIQHFEKAIANPLGEADPNVRATLSRLYLMAAANDKAIVLLIDLVKQQPGWTDGPTLLIQAFTRAGRNKDAIEWLDAQAGFNPLLLPTLADFYEREMRWKEAAGTYERALQIVPGNIDIKSRYAAALVNAGGRDDLVKARGALNDVVAANASNARALYLLSQVNRRLGDSQGAEATARRLIAVQRQSPYGYYALAQSLEQRRQWRTMIDDLTPAVALFRGMSGDHSFELTMLLPYLGFSHQQLGEHEKAIASFEEARRLTPKDAAVTSYLIEANLAARKFAAAVDVARQARADFPNDFRIARLQAQALRQDGKTEQGMAVIEDAARKNADEPFSYIALAQFYSDASRGPQAVKVLQDAQARFPSDNSIAFQLGAVFDKQKKYTDAEAAFKQVLARDPDNAAALNYLGYMLADRGERLDESVGYLVKAVQMEPDNGSYLDSLGWAYFKADKLTLAEDNLRRAADQLVTNSVIQEHYGQLLFKLGRYDEAIAAWNRALGGDGDSIDRSDIDKKIRAARQKLPRR